MKKTRYILFLLVTAIAVFVACNKRTPTWDTQILAPIVNTSMSVNNLVTGTTVKANPDSSVTIVYSDSLYTLNQDSLFRIPDTTVLFAFPSPITTTVSPGGTIYSSTTTSKYGVSSVQLTEAIIKSGFVKFEVISHVHGLTDFSYTAPGATLSGNPLSFTMKVPAATGTSPGIDSIILPLDGYKIDFTGPSHNSYNLLTTIVNGILDPSAPPTVVNAGDSLIVRTTFYSLVPYYGQGYFGKSVRNIGPKTTAFPLFKKFTSGSLSLQDVTVNFTLKNGFGVDASINISQLTSLNRAGAAVSLTDPAIIGNTIHINRATQTYNPAAPVNPTVQTFTIDPSNSNILAWVDNLPVNVQTALQITTNPLGNVSGSNDFAFYGYGIQAYLDVTVPLSLVASNLTLADTVAVNYGSGSTSFQQIKSGTFTLYATNDFPFSAGMQIYLLDGTNTHIIDSIMLPNQSIAAGTTDATTGKVISPVNSQLVIQLNVNQAKELFNTKNIIITSRFNMNCPTCIPAFSKIYDYYYLNLKLVGNFDYQVKG